MSMARRSAIPLSEVIQQLSCGNSLEDPLDDGSDDDLGMDSDYDCDSSMEGIIIYY